MVTFLGIPPAAGAAPRVARGLLADSPVSLSEAMGYDRPRSSSSTSASPSRGYAAYKRQKREEAKEAAALSERYQNFSSAGASSSGRTVGLSKVSGRPLAVPPQPLSAGNPERASQLGPPVSQLSGQPLAESQREPVATVDGSSQPLPKGSAPGFHAPGVQAAAASQPAAGGRLIGYPIRRLLELSFGVGFGHDRKAMTEKQLRDAIMGRAKKIGQKLSLFLREHQAAGIAIPASVEARVERVVELALEMQSWRPQ